MKEKSNQVTYPPFNFSSVVDKNSNRDVGSLWYCSFYLRIVNCTMYRWNAQVQFQRLPSSESRLSFVKGAEQIYAQDLLEHGFSTQNYSIHSYEKWQTSLVYSFFIINLLSKKQHTKSNTKHVFSISISFIHFTVLFDCAAKQANNINGWLMAGCGWLAARLNEVSSKFKSKTFSPKH